MNSNGFLVNEDMLWDYADGLLSAAERAQVDAYMAQHPEQQLRLQSVLADRKALMQLPLDSPRAGFADKVMAAWVSEQVHERAVTTADKKVLLFPLVLGSMLVGALIAVLTVVFSSAMPAAAPLDVQQNLPEISPDAIMQVLLNPVTKTVLFAGFCLAFLGLLDGYLRLHFQKVG